MTTVAPAPISLAYSEAYGAFVATPPDAVLAVLQGLRNAQMPNIVMVDVVTATQPAG